MAKTCIVTGGAGFIGCAISGGLADRFDRVVVIDCLHPQIHPQRTRPGALDPRVELLIADACIQDTWDAALPFIGPVDTAIDLAAETGTAQSLAHASRHGRVNVVGTTQMMDAFVRHGTIPRQVLLASSRAVYGEGAWQREDGSVFYPGQRSHAQLEGGQWDFPLARHLPFRADTTQPRPASVYAATKLCQENLLCAWGQAVGCTVKTLRLQNVYGPGQSLINPYTGIVSLFVRMAKAGESIPLYEDGEILRDFVLIDDTADAILLAVDQDAPDGFVLDIGYGQAATIAQIAKWIADHYGAPAPHICGKFRDGDVRHASCDISEAARVLGYAPRFPVSEGLDRLCAWIDAQLG